MCGLKERSRPGLWACSWWVMYRTGIRSTDPPHSGKFLYYTWFLHVLILSNCRLCSAVVLIIEKNPCVSWPAQFSLVLFSGQPYKITYRKSRVTERNAEDFSLMVGKNKSKETWESGRRQEETTGKVFWRQGLGQPCWRLLSYQGPQSPLDIATPR